MGHRPGATPPGAGDGRWHDHQPRALRPRHHEAAWRRTHSGAGAKGCGTIWVVGLGFIHEPKAFFYAQTIRKAFLKARKAYKASRLAEHTPWGSQPFRPKPRQRRGRERRPAATAASA